MKSGVNAMTAPIHQRRFCYLLALGMIAATTILILGSDARAEIMIVSSDAAALKAGTEIADNASIDIPAGATVRIMLPSGKTQTLSGPTVVSVADLMKGEPPSASILQKAKEFLATGGADQSRPGATRGARGSKARGQQFSWTVIPPDASGTICVERGAKLLLARSATSKAGEVTVIDTAANARGTSLWAIGAVEAQWPTEVEPKSGTTYQVTVFGEQVRQLKLSLVDKAMTDDANALKTLIEANCKAQVSAWLAAH
jgi:hypothetical protein